MADRPFVLKTPNAGSMMGGFGGAYLKCEECGKSLILDTNGHGYVLTIEKRTGLLHPHSWGLKQGFRVKMELES